MEIDPKKLADSIKGIEVCENCQRVVHIVALGSEDWFAPGFFQCGGNKQRLFSWCSDECCQESLSTLTTLNNK